MTFNLQNTHKIQGLVFEIFNTNTKCIHPLYGDSAYPPREKTMITHLVYENNVDSSIFFCVKTQIN
jgi:hypothetical protein